MNEIIEEKKELEKQNEKDKLNIKELNDQIEVLKKDLNEISIEKNIINDKYNLTNEDNFNLKKENKNLMDKNIV